MIGYEKQWMQFAIAIHEQLQTAKKPRVTFELPTNWEHCEVLIRRMSRANLKGWHLAAARLQRDLREGLRRLQSEITTILSLLNPASNSFPRASVRDIYADLLTLGKEFEEVSFEREEQTIAVTIEAIELEEVYLGPFEIRLNVNALADDDPHAYCVIAVDPHPAAANDSVTHPHVQDESLCEGDGREPIRQALQQGRLLDFFMIVANLLGTYNPDSPYVSLNHWFGIDCADCGISVPDDDGFTCGTCDALVCDACYCGCTACDQSYCAECVTYCQACNDNYCNHCMRACALCDASVCPECLTDNERCLSCHDQETKKTQEDQFNVQEGSRDVPANITI